MLSMDLRIIAAPIFEVTIFPSEQTGLVIPRDVSRMDNTGNTFWTAARTTTAVDPFNRLNQEQVDEVESFARNTGPTTFAHRIIKCKPIRSESFMDYLVALPDVSFASLSAK